MTAPSSTGRCPQRAASRAVPRRGGRARVDDRRGDRSASGSASAFADESAMASPHGLGVAQADAILQRHVAADRALGVRAALFHPGPVARVERSRDTSSTTIVRQRFGDVAQVVGIERRAAARRARSGRSDSISEVADARCSPRRAPARPAPAAARAQTISRSSIGSASRIVRQVGRHAWRRSRRCSSTRFCRCWSCSSRSRRGPSCRWRQRVEDAVAARAAA